MPLEFNIRRSKSDESIFGALNLSCPKISKREEDRSMLMTIESLIADKDSSSKTKVFKKTIKKSKSRMNRDYQKNICGYITKKIIREFGSDTYKEKV